MRGRKPFISARAFFTVSFICSKNNPREGTETGHIVCMYPSPDGRLVQKNNPREGTETAILPLSHSLNDLTAVQKNNPREGTETFSTNDRNT